MRMTWEVMRSIRAYPGDIRGMEVCAETLCIYKSTQWKNVYIKIYLWENREKDKTAPAAYKNACVYYAIPISAYTHANIHTDCQTCILKHTHYYICVYQAIHIAIFPPFIEKLEDVPERKPGVRSDWHIHILLYTSDCVHKLYTLSCRLGIMSEYMFLLCILSCTLFIFIVYIILYEFQRGCAEEQMGFLGTAGLARTYCVY